MHQACADPRYARELPSLPRTLSHGAIIPDITPLTRASAALRSSVALCRARHARLLYPFVYAELIDVKRPGDCKEINLSFSSDTRTDEPGQNLRQRIQGESGGRTSSNPEISLLRASRFSCRTAFSLARYAATGRYAVFRVVQLIFQWWRRASPRER